MLLSCPLALPGLSLLAWQPSWTKADGAGFSPEPDPGGQPGRSSTPALLPASRASNPAGGKRPEVACRRSQTWGCRRVWDYLTFAVEEGAAALLSNSGPARYPTSLLPVLSPVGIEAGAQSAWGVCVCACMCACVCVMRVHQLLAT